MLEWLFWQMANVGPIFGQAGHFVNAAPEKIPYAIDRYANESARLIKVLDNQLANTEYIAGDYSIADIATYPWLVVGFPAIKAVKPDVVGEECERRAMDRGGRRAPGREEGHGSAEGLACGDVSG